MSEATKHLDIEIATGASRPRDDGQAPVLPSPAPAAVPPPTLSETPASEVTASIPIVAPSRAVERQALLMMVGSACAFGVMAFCAKLASQRGIGARSGRCCARQG